MERDHFYTSASTMVQGTYILFDKFIHFIKLINHSLLGQIVSVKNMSGHIHTFIYYSVTLNIC